MNTQLPACPKCQSEYVYQDMSLFICPECNCEWDPTDVEDEIIVKDIHGNKLAIGDKLTLIKDLKVKGSSLVAKQGTAVRRISLDQENAEFIEGKVGPTQIVIITKYVKKL